MRRRNVWLRRPKNVWLGCLQNIAGLVALILVLIGFMIVVGPPAVWPSEYIEWYFTSGPSYTLTVEAEDQNSPRPGLRTNNPGQYFFVVRATADGFSDLLRYRIGDFPFWDRWSIPPGGPEWGAGSPDSLPRAVFELPEGEYYVMTTMPRGVPLTWRQMSPGEIQQPQTWGLYVVPLWGYVNLTGNTNMTLRWQNLTPPDPGTPCNCPPLGPWCEGCP